MQERKKYISENKLTGERVLNEEMFVRRDIVAKSIEEIKKCYRYIYTDFSYLSYEYCNIYPLIVYKEITKKKSLNKDDVDCVLTFLGSKDYVIPYDKIFSELISKILVGNERIKKGDVRDIQNISLILPYATIMITEKAMKGHIEQLKLDKKYGTKIFSLNQINEAVFELENIR